MPNDNCMIQISYEKKKITACWYMYHDLSKGLEKLKPKGLIDCPPSVKKPRLILIYTEKAIPDKD